MSERRHYEIRVVLSHCRRVRSLHQRTFLSLLVKFASTFDGLCAFEGHNRVSLCLQFCITRCSYFLCLSSECAQFDTAMLK